MKISQFSIKRPVFTLVTMFIFIILGIVSVIGTPLKLIPSINPPVGAVVASYPSAGPTEVVEEVSKPLEDNLSTISGLKSISSTSQEGSSVTILQFTNDTDIDDVQSDIQNAIDSTDLPDSVSNARFMKFDPSQFPIMQIAISSPNDDINLETKAQDLKQKLSQVDGVASVNYKGLTVDEIKVQLDQSQLKSYQLTQSDVVQSLQANNVSVPGSTVKSGDKQLTTRIISQLHSVADVKDVVVTQAPNGNDVTIKDISQIKVAPTNDNTITRSNQESALLMNVMQQSDANTASVSKAFNKKLDDLMGQDQYDDMESAVLFDQGTFVQQAVSSMIRSLILGAVFAMIVLFFFLRNFKTPLIIGVSIPFSVIVTFVLVYFSGFTLNIMTLGGLALGIGMLVDNSIVVIENIYRHINMGKDGKVAAFEGTKEVGVAIIASTLTTVAVFVPVFFITGIIGDLFKEFSLTIAFSLLASLFVALTVVPMIASRILKPSEKNIEEKRRNSGLVKSIGNAAAWALNHRITVLLITILLLAGGIFGLTRTGTQFLPQQDQGFFTINLEMENGTALDTTDKVVQNVEDVLDDQPAVKDYFSLVGSSQSQGPGGEGTPSQAQIYISMADQDNRDMATSGFIEEIRNDVEDAAVKAKKVELNQQNGMGSEANVLTFNVRDDNIQRLDKAVQDISKTVKDIDDVVEVTNNESETVQELQIQVDNEAARDHGFTPGQIAQVVNSVTRGTDATQLTTKDSQVLDVNVSYNNETTESKQALKDLMIKAPTGQYVALNEVTSMKTGDSPVAINRKGQQRAVEFTVEFSNDTTLGEVKSAIQKDIKDLDLDDEVDVSYTGDFEMLQNAIQKLGLAFGLAVILVYFVMAAQFESFKYPFVIMLTVPLVFIGVALGLTMTQTPISATALIGLVVLAGIVVNNAIVLVDYINQLKASGERSYDAIIEAVKVRTRPILMTAITTILGLVPIAIGIGQGTEIQQPMGITVIGGMISATFLTLLVVPVVYSYFDKETRRMHKYYVTPDGMPIPAYLVDERRKQDQLPDGPKSSIEGEISESDTSTSEADEDDQERHDQQLTQRGRSDDDMIHMLENLLKMAKDNQHHKKDDDDSQQ
ncbi:efflux RND transporter permease subunit [Tuberibacillus sp. Marseille-P3662]|uniref:efflux RND transporter permease subunit n=1 Tax=Tuberibacillus sp. Marseille-P3662 TaxID=1965358 RepID=UPI000A1CE908|nr:efflux RND transporter permease subunit [Tuberibacillus sp. Marseille-P3662]